MTIDQLRTDLMTLASETEIRELKRLIVHCWIHSGYQNCGYDQMTTEERALFDSITKNAEDIISSIGDPQP